MKILALCFLTILFISCDPSHSIVFINKTDSNAKVEIKIKKKSNNYSLKRVSIGDSIVFNLKPNKINENTENIYFGIGVWDDSEISELANSLESIKIETIDKKIIYKSKKSVVELLKQNEDGFIWKTKINIKIE